MLRYLPLLLWLIAAPASAQSQWTYIAADTTADGKLQREIYGKKSSARRDGDIITLVELINFSIPKKASQVITLEVKCSMSATRGVFHESYAAHFAKGRKTGDYDWTQEANRPWFRSKNADYNKFLKKLCEMM